ncbi:hypothetical protein B0T10DRAFT_150110 [Thelonectria olida]|uniref:GED domain-containing protein n=1 Tax=Thelonectria olida TaxID=1576542 RepID=A0A9P8VW41_9HYPO|nr:hypothetical protein B0T10DRAFT_150110 [Thelonectria olida]
MSEERLRELAAESIDTTSRRKTLNKEIGMFRDGLAQCRRCRPRTVTGPWYVQRCVMRLRLEEQRYRHQRQRSRRYLLQAIPVRVSLCGMLFNEGADWLGTASPSKAIVLRRASSPGPIQEQPTTTHSITSLLTTSASPTEAATVTPKSPVAVNVSPAFSRNGISTLAECYY